MRFFDDFINLLTINNLQKDRKLSSNKEIEIELPLRRKGETITTLSSAVYSVMALRLRCKGNAITG